MYFAFIVVLVSLAFAVAQFEDMADNLVDRTQALGTTICESKGEDYITYTARYNAIIVDCTNSKEVVIWEGK